MPGLIRGVARTAVVAGTATAVSNRVSRRQANRWADKQQQEYEHEQYVQQQSAPPPQYAQPAPQYAQPAAPPPPQTSMDDKIEQLRKLGELKTAGVLTDAEFEYQKHAILNS